MKNYFLLFLYCFICLHSFSQRVGIGTTTPHASALLEIKSTNSGVLVPRMTSAQRIAITIPAQGLLVYDLDTNSFWFYSGTSWINQSASAGSGWSLTGNSGTNPASHFVGTTDNLPLRFRLNNTWAGEINPLSFNVFMGMRAGEGIQSGANNTAIGAFSMNKNTDGHSNTSIGFSALYSNTIGIQNTAVGMQSLYSNTQGNSNTALGFNTLSFNTSGVRNTAIGESALRSNTTAGSNIAIGKDALFLQSYNNGDVQWVSNNVAVGAEALYSNQPTSTANAISNTAVGNFALRGNTIGFDNTAIGTSALYTNTKGYENTAIGRQALFYSDSGFSNTATGYKALRENITGFGNTANGVEALFNNTSGTENTALGRNALANLTRGFQNIAIGSRSGTHPSAPDIFNTISIGNNGFLNAFQNQVFIGNLSTIFIGGQVNWSTYSDERIKRNITEDVKGLDFITRLRPVIYNKNFAAITSITGNTETENFPGKYDGEKIKYSGFLAQEVEAAAIESNYNFSGLHRPKGKFDLYSLSYAEFVVPLVKAVQEQQQIIDDLTKKVVILMREMQVIKQQR